MIVNKTVLTYRIYNYDHSPNQYYFKGVMWEYWNPRTKKSLVMVLKGNWRHNRDQFDYK
jgi:hypothetical protein